MFQCGRKESPVPARYPSANPWKNLRMNQAAAEGMIVTMRCTACRRETHFWAADLVKVLGPNHQVHVPPWPCSRCRTTEFLSMRWAVATASMLAQGLTVRRPVSKIEKWLWRNERA
jgi:hypothetical protein